MFYTHFVLNIEYRKLQSTARAKFVMLFGTLIMMCSMFHQLMAED